MKTLISKKPPRFLIGRVNQAMDIIEQGLAVMKRPYVSCSWGKDSTALLWLLIGFNPDIPVVHFHSSYQLPEIPELRDELIEKWQLNYLEIPGRDLSEMIDWLGEIGLPDISRKPAQQRRVVTELKTDKGREVAQEHGLDGMFWGLRAAESRARRNLFRGKSPLYQGQDGLWRCAPLAWWSDSDLWALIDHFRIPYAKLYDKTLFEPREKIRNAGWLTTDGARYGRLVWLKYYYPNHFNQLAGEFPEVRDYV